VASADPVSGFVNTHLRLRYHAKAVYALMGLVPHSPHQHPRRTPIFSPCAPASPSLSQSNAYRMQAARQMCVTLTRECDTARETW